MPKRKIIKWSCLLIWMTIIFILSNQPNSGEFTYSIIDNIFNSPNSIINIINFIARKLAHFTEYFILAFFTINVLKEYTKKEKIILIISIIICFTYAITDEFHQAFVIGRTSQFKDVLIDTSRSIVGVLIYKYKKKIPRK